MQTRAIVDFGELSLNRAMRVYGPIGDLSFVDGRYYPSKAPLLSFAAVPVYAVLHSLSGNPKGSVPEIPFVFWSRFFLTVAPTLLMLILLRRFLIAFVPAATADALVLTYSVGTLAFSYSLLFMSHQTSAVLLFASFYALWCAPGAPHRVLMLALGGALAGLAVAAEYTSALGASLLAVYVGLTALPRNPRRVATGVIAFGAGAAPIIALLMLYHTQVFGGPFETGYRHLADLAYQPWHQGGFLGIKTPDARAFLLSLFSPLRGLFALSPILLLGFGGFGLLWRKRQLSDDAGAIAIFTLLLMLGYLYFTASFSYASWGWTTGPRHLTGLVPFLLLPAALVLERFRDSSLRGLLAGLALASILVTGALTSINYIPDDVSDGVFALFVPLLARGNVLPTILNSLGFPNPSAGLTLLALVLGIGLLVTATIVNGRGRTAQLMLASATAALVIGTHRAAFRDSPSDRGALELLARDWLAPAGVRWSFWSSAGRN